MLFVDKHRELIYYAFSYAGELRPQAYRLAGFLFFGVSCQSSAVVQELTKTSEHLS